MAEVIRAECPTKFLKILPFEADVVEQKDDNTVIIEFEHETITPKEGFRMCADLMGPTMLGLLLFDGERNHAKFPLTRQIENDPEKKGQPTYVLGVVYDELKTPKPKGKGRNAKAAAES